MPNTVAFPADTQRQLSTDRAAAPADTHTKIGEIGPQRVIRCACRAGFADLGAGVSGG
jgi:hypothetical protein